MFAECKYRKALAAWQVQHDGYVAAIDLAQSYTGERPSGVMLDPGEAVYATITHASLVEERKGPGSWSGRSSGFSVPVASIGGHSIRCRVGATHGHYQQGTPQPTAIDVGTVFVTSKRVLFEGGQQTRVVELRASDRNPAR